jgi:hypothetical protein
VVGDIVIGTEVTMVEPCALVVVTLANEAEAAGALLVLWAADTSLDGKGAVASDGVAGPCAAEGVTESGRRKRRREGTRDEEKTMALREEEKEDGASDEGVGGERQSGSHLLA